MIRSLPGCGAETGSRDEGSTSSASTTGDSHSLGLGLLVGDEPDTTLYRLRVLGDSYDQQGQASATFDYEPVPASP